MRCADRASAVNGGSGLNVTKVENRVSNFTTQFLLYDRLFTSSYVMQEIGKVKAS